MNYVNFILNRFLAKTCIYSNIFTDVCDSWYVKLLHVICTIHNISPVREKTLQWSKPKKQDENEQKPSQNFSNFSCHAEAARSWTITRASLILDTQEYMFPILVTRISRVPLRCQCAEESIKLVCIQWSNHVDLTLSHYITPLLTCNKWCICFLDIFQEDQRKWLLIHME